MSGWLVLRTREGAAPDGAAWASALAAVGGQKVQEWSAPDGRTKLAAWRREKGEYEHSGLLHRTDGGRGCVAWTGVCLEDAGENTKEAIDLMSGAAPARVASLNGEFAAAAVDGQSGALRLWTDRHRHYPVYLWRGEGMIAASTEFACVVPFIPTPALHRPSIDLFLRIGEFIDTRTPLEGVEMLPSATCFRDEPGGQPSSTRYWQMRHRGDPKIGLESAASEVAARLSSSVHRLQARYPRLITPLSGGLDSRLILGLCRNPESVPSITWGDAGCRDLLYAEDFAARIKSPHRSLPFDPPGFPPRWGEAVTATAGCFPVRDMFIFPFVRGLAGQADVALNGLAGDAFLGGNFLKNSWMGVERLPDLAAQTWRWRIPAEEEELTGRLLVGGGEPDPRQEWIRSITSSGEGRPIEVLSDWLFENRVFRFTNCGTQLLRTALESYSPFFDRDVADYLLRVPMEIRFKHRLYLKVLPQASPAAAEVPWQRTAIAPKHGYAASLASMAYHKVMRVVGKRLGFVPFPGDQVASPADWFRGPWAEPAKAILFSERALSRKLVDPDALRRVWDAHQAGMNLSRALGSLVALELLCLKFLDKVPVTEGKPA